MANPSTATGVLVKWKSSDSKIAKIDAAGKITALRKGTVKITATVGKKTKTMTITVK